MAPRPITLAAQLEEIAHVRALRPRVRGERPAEAEIHAARLAAVARTLDWLRQHEAEIRAFLSLAPQDRAAVLSHGPLVAQLAAEIARREALAKVGGPLR